MNEYFDPVLAGYCRRCHENKAEPVVLVDDSVERIKREKDYPQNFDEKKSYMLRLIYSTGGAQYVAHEYNSSIDYTLCFAENHDEFERILFALSKEGFVEYAKQPQHTEHHFSGLRLTPQGIADVNRKLPRDIVTGLVKGVISTGIPDADERIKHAIELYEERPESMEHLRSACLALTGVLERYRDDLSPTFTNRDTDTFFRLVNEFDVRHSKDRIMQVEHPEQLDWMYITFLNSIRTYFKLKTRIMDGSTS